MSLESKIRLVFKNRILSHILFWVAYILLYGIVYGSYNEEYEKEIVVQLIYFPPRILLTYFTLYYLLPQFLLKEKLMAFTVAFILSTMVSGVLQRFITFYIEYPMYYPGFQEAYPLWLSIKIIKNMISVYPVVFMALAIKLLKYWYIDQKDKQNLVSEKLEAELKFLKTQIHPHFLFNTLNNLYALTLKKDDQAPEMVLKLSELINYMLYECNADKVPLEKEINFSKNYIEIEKMRHDNNLEVNMSVSGPINEVKIAPMIILPFLENSFKHGVNEALEKSWISFQVSVEKGPMTDKFILKVENTKSETQNLLKNGGGEGIGLVNVRRRLDLLYKNNYILSTHDDEGFYLVILEVNLINA